MIFLRVYLSFGGRQNVLARKRITSSLSSKTRTWKIGCHFDLGWNFATRLKERQEWKKIFLRLQFVAAHISDVSPIIGYASHQLTPLLTHSCLVNLMDATLARCRLNTCWGCYCWCWETSKQIWNLMFWRQDRFLFTLWSQGLVKILKLKFWLDWRYILVSILLLMLGRDSEDEFWSRFM